MYKLTDKAINGKFRMLSELTISAINQQIGALTKDPDFIKHNDFFFVKLSHYYVCFKDPEMNKLDAAVGFYTFIIYLNDIEEVDMKETLKGITTGVWYDVSDIIQGKYDLEEAIEKSYDVLACERDPDEIGINDNFTSNTRSYNLGYIRKDDYGYKFYVNNIVVRPLEAFVRMMFIPSKTEEE